MDDKEFEENAPLSGIDNFVEDMKRARGEAQRKTMARQDAARRAAASVASTPASVPSIPSTPVPAPPLDLQQMIPTQEPAPVVHAASSQPSPEQFIGLQILPLRPNQFVVPLSLNAGVQSIYMDELQNVKKLVKDTINDGGLTESSLWAMNNLMERLKMICDHQDLILPESPSQGLNSDEYTAKWAENISTKCVFVIDLLSNLPQHIDAHIVILVRPGRMLSILEACFRYKKYSYWRYDQPEDLTNIRVGSLKITLVPTDINHTSGELKAANIVIAFDSTFEPDRHFKNLRGNCQDPDMLAPLIKLVVIKSVEHLELCIPKHVTASDHINALVNGVIKIGEGVGRHSKDYHLPDAASVEVASYILAYPNVDWPLLPAPGIRYVDISFPTNPEPAINLTQPFGSTIQFDNDSSMGSTGDQSGWKRPLVGVLLCPLFLTKN